MVPAGRSGAAAGSTLVTRIPPHAGEVAIPRGAMRPSNDRRTAPEAERRVSQPRAPKAAARHRTARRRLAARAPGSSRARSRPLARSRSARPRTSPSCSRRCRSRPRPGPRARVAAQPRAADEDRLAAARPGAGRPPAGVRRARADHRRRRPRPPGADRQRVLVLARGRGDPAAGRGRRAPSRRSRGRAVELAGAPWRQDVSHQRHHAVVTFGDAELRVPKGGLPWSGPSFVNLVVGAEPSRRETGRRAAGRPEREDADRRPGHGRDPGRCASAPATRPEPPAEREATCLCAGVAGREDARRWCSSHELADLAAGRAPARPRAPGHRRRRASPRRPGSRPRLFVADSPNQTEPGGAAAAALTWKGHLSKFTGFNCLPGRGPADVEQVRGRDRARRRPAGSLYVNLVAVSGAPVRRPIAERAAARSIPRRARST